jgi:uncharacterized protein
MKIENEFRVSVPIEKAWEVLTDLEGIAPCLPGAQLTGSDGDTFTGRVKIKVGPVTSEYAGTASFVEKDDAAHRAVIDAKGKDSRGAGNASAMITARLTPHGEHTVVNVDTDLKISGKIAQFGSGMIKEVSEKLLGQFVVSLEAKLAATQSPGPLAAPPAPAAAASVANGAGPTAVRAVATAPEPEALDLMELAGGAVYKRLIPIAVGVAVVVAAIIIHRRGR